MIVTKEERNKIVFEKKSLFYTSIVSILFMMVAIAVAIYNNHILSASYGLVFLLFLGGMFSTQLNNLYKEVKSDFPDIIVGEQPSK